MKNTNQQVNIINNDDFVLKIQETLETFHPNDDGLYVIWDEFIQMRFEYDSDKDKIIETLNKILVLINTSDLEKQELLFDTEISDLVKMVNS